MRDRSGSDVISTHAQEVQNGGHGGVGFGSHCVGLMK